MLSATSSTTLRCALVQKATLGTLLPTVSRNLLVRIPFHASPFDEYPSCPTTHSEPLFFLAQQPVEASDPCNPSPCGSNAVCNDGVCSCLPEFQGDPYSGCRPECVLNTDCPRNRACIRNKCTDPCPGTCGQDAQCSVVNHIPMCTCPQGMSGNPFIQCRPFAGG